MEKLPEHKILQFHSDTLQYVRKDLGLDKPGQMDAAIDLLDDWIKKQAHFNKRDFSREYLERTIVLDKGSVEKAKMQLEKLFTMRTRLPYLFNKIDVYNDYEDVHDYYVQALLPKLTKEHYRIYAGKSLKDGFTAKLLGLTYQYGALVFDHTRSNDYCTGFVSIIDHRNINLTEFVASINIMEIYQLLSLITEGYQARIKGLHIISASKAVEILVRIFKQIFSKKIGDRIQIHSTIDTLYEYVPRDLLPQEFGGELKSLVDLNKDWIEHFGCKENMEYLKEMNKATINEKLKNVSDYNNSDMLGVSGSFKKLCVH